MQLGWSSQRAGAVHITVSALLDGLSPNPNNGEWGDFLSLREDIARGPIFYGGKFVPMHFTSGDPLLYMD